MMTTWVDAGDGSPGALVLEIYARKRQITRLRQEIARLEQALLLAELRHPVRLPALEPPPAPGPLDLELRHLALTGQGVR